MKTNQDNKEQQNVSEISQIAVKIIEKYQISNEELALIVSRELYVNGITLDILKEEKYYGLLGIDEIIQYFIKKETKRMELGPNYPYDEMKVYHIKRKTNKGVKKCQNYQK